MARRALGLHGSQPPRLVGQTWAAGIGHTVMNRPCLGSKKGERVAHGQHALMGNHRIGAGPQHGVGGS
jgi:hypothetical protein